MVYNLLALPPFFQYPYYIAIRFNVHLANYANDYDYNPSADDLQHISSYQKL